MTANHGCVAIGTKKVRFVDHYKHGVLFQSDHDNKWPIFLDGFELLPGQNVTLSGDVIAVSTADDQLLRWLGQGVDQ
jgi:hypothetical protein